MKSVKIIQCYQCGEYLDNRKIITKEEAEKALAERSKSNERVSN